MKNTMVSMVLFLSLAGACNKKAADAPPTPVAKETGSAAVVTAPTPAPTPAPAEPAAAPTPVPAATTTTIGSYDDYKKAGNELITVLTATFTADGANCDKLGDDVSKIIADRQSTFDAIKTYEGGHKDDKKKYDTDPDAKVQQKAFMDAAMPAMKSCKDNAKLKAAFAKLG